MSTCVEGQLTGLRIFIFQVGGDVMKICRMRWHRHVERKDDADYVKTYTRLAVKGKAPVDRPRKTWQNTLSADMRLLKF